MVPLLENQVYLEQVGYMSLLFPTANFRNSKYKSIISNENLASNLKCAASVKYKPDFEDLVWKKQNVKYLY